MKVSLEEIDNKYLVEELKKAEAEIKRLQDEPRMIHEHYGRIDTTNISVDGKPSIREQLKIMKEALEYYSLMNASCQHDDPSWCDHCPDYGMRAREALEKVKEE